MKCRMFEEIFHLDHILTFSLYLTGCSFFIDILYVISPSCIRGKSNSQVCMCYIIFNYNIIELSIITMCFSLSGKCHGVYLYLV